MIILHITRSIKEYSMEAYLHILSETIIATFAVVTIVSFFGIFFTLIPTWHDNV